MNWKRLPAAGWDQFDIYFGLRTIEEVGAQPVYVALEEQPEILSALTTFYRNDFHEERVPLEDLGAKVERFRRGIEDLNSIWPQANVKFQAGPWSKKLEMTLPGKLPAELLRQVLEIYSQGDIDETE